jgi:4-amino-4-deoxy-L-arabinose transferase-like glycosyltransferase
MQQIILKVKKNYYIVALLFILGLSFGLNFYAISNNGTGNEYYAACIKSMTQSFKNFFFVSFDPSGMVSVDKPPLGLWMQAISVLVFGYHGWAMLLPQALAGTASCFMIYILTAKHFGRPAGLISSLIFAVSPAVVVASRNNTIDMQLIFVLLLAAWFLLRSIESGKRSYLFLTAVFVGLGFNIKMLQAYMILPAIIVTYLFFAKEKISKRLLNGVLSVAIMLAVSFSWVLIVEFYPAANRPYVDSTSNNSMLELILNHNGMDRLWGSSSGGGIGKTDSRDNTNKTKDEDAFSTDLEIAPPTDKGDMPPQTPDSSPADRQRHDAGQFGDQNQRDGAVGGGMGSSEIGSASPIRLWTSNLYGQGSWLLFFAVASMFACIPNRNSKKKLLQGVFLFWSLWLITMVIFFSFAGFYHRYYLCMLAPGIAILSGIGITEIYNGFKNKKERKEYIRPVILLTAFVANLILQIGYVLQYAQLTNWLLPIIVGFAVLGTILLIVHFFKQKRIILIVSILALLISSLTAPLYWSLMPVMYSPNSTMPYAGPELAESRFLGKDDSKDKKKETQTNFGLEKYLVSHYKEDSFLVVSQRANDVADFIINTGLPCYAYGGFLGSDNSLTVDQLKALVSQGKVTYFLLSSQNGSGNSEITTYVKENAVLVDESEYSSPNSNVGQIGGQSGKLYLFQ